MAIYKTAVVITGDSKGAVSAFRATSDEAKKLAGANEGATKSANDYSAALGKLKGALAVLGIGLSVRELVQQADGWSMLEGRLRTVTDSTEQLMQVRSELLRVSQQTRTDVQATSDLYIKLATAGAELGVTQRDLIQFTENVGNALILSGTNATQASGALLQLSQAVGSGIVRAEEFNSILEAAPVIVQTVARNLDEAGGSVARLRTLVASGQITSKEFFDAFQAGGAQLAETAGDIPVTVGAAITQLKNGLFALIGVSDQALGSSSALAQMISDLGGLFVVAANNTSKSVNSLRESEASVVDWSDVMLTVIATTADGIYAGFQTIKTVLSTGGLTTAAAFAQLRAVVSGEFDLARNIGNEWYADITKLLGGFVDDPNITKFRDALEQIRNGMPNSADTALLDQIIGSTGKAAEIAAPKVDKLAQANRKLLESLRADALSESEKALAQFEQRMSDLQGLLDAGLIGEGEFGDLSERFKTQYWDKFASGAEDAKKEIEAVDPFESLRDTLVDLSTDWGKATANIVSGIKTIQKANTGMFGDAAKGWGQVAAGASQYFDEGSGGYKVLQAASQAFYTFEIAQQAASAIASITAQKTKQGEAATTALAEGTAQVASSGVGLPYPYNLAAMAATIAFLASLGIGMRGGKSGGGALDSNALTSGRLATSGTVLGDPKAQSESFANSLDLLADLADKGLDVNRQMLNSLQRIESSLGSVTSQFARIAADRGTQAIGISGTVGNVQASGPDAASLIDWFLGDVDPQSLSSLTPAIQNVFDGIGGALAGAIEALGGDVDAALTIFENIGLSFLIKEGADVDQVIAGIINAVGDSAYAIILDQLGLDLLQFANYGEGAAETLTRLAAEVGILKDVADQFGMSLDGVLPADLVGAADALAESAGGIANFAENTAEFFDFALTDAQMLDRQRGQLESLFADLGLVLPDSRDGVLDLVQGLDLLTEEGQRAYTAITAATPAMEEFFESMEKIASLAYDFDTALGLNDGLGPMRDALTSVGLTLDQVTEAAQRFGVEGLQTLLGGLDDAAKAILEPFIGDILNEVLGSSTVNGYLSEQEAARKAAADAQARALGDAKQSVLNWANSLTGTIASLNTPDRALSQLQAQFNTGLAMSGGNRASRIAGLEMISEVGPELQRAIIANAATAQDAQFGLAVLRSQALDAVEGDVPQQHLAVSKDQLDVMKNVNSVMARGVESARANSERQVQAIRELRAEMRGLRAEFGALNNSSNTTARILERLIPDGDALVVRTAE